MNEGFVLLHRELFEDEIWKEEKPQTVLLFIYLIGKANHADRPFGNIVIRRGQRLTNIPELVAGLNNWYTYDQIDKALYRLKAKGAITAVKSGSRKLLITVCNYDKYQSRTESQKSGCRKPDSEEAEMSHSEHFEANSSDTKAEQTAGQDGEKTGAKNKELIIKKEYSEEQIKRFVAMQEWIWEHCPTVALMPQPFTIEQYLLIRKSYFPEHSSQRFMKILTDMEAWEGLEKRKSAYKTFLTFYKRSQESQSKPMFFIPKQPKMVI